MARDQHAALWREATSFDDLLELSGRFLRGDLSYFPGWMAQDLDEESDAMAPTLSAAHRAGMITVASQPGEPFGPGHDGLLWAGRAFVGGFARAQDAGAILRRAQGADLWVIGSGEDEGRDGVTAGLRDGTPYLVLGRDAAESELEIFGEDVGETALADLHDAVFIWVVDPVWGRRDRLRVAF